MDMSSSALEMLIVFGVVVSAFCGLMIWWALTTSDTDDNES